MKKVILLLLTVLITAACSKDEKDPAVTSLWKTKDMTSSITFYDNNTAHVKNADIDMTGEVTIDKKSGVDYLVISFGPKDASRAYFIITPATISIQSQEITVEESYRIGGDVVEKELTRTYYPKINL